MKKLSVLFLILLMVTALTAGCGAGKKEEGLKFDFSFNNGDQGWSGGFADLPVDYEEDIYELDFNHTDWPAGLDGTGKALMLKGHNRSDDLFMFVKKQLTAADGIKPNTTYKVYVKVEFATNALAGAIGIGGPPGEALFMKVGAAGIEPEALENNETGGNNYYRMNIDKGAQSDGGRNAVVVGNAAKTENEEFDVYELKTLDNSEELIEVTADAEGNLWLFIGSDSGFEGLTTLYYTRIQAELK